MKTPLDPIIQNLHDQNAKTARARHDFLEKEAERKNFESKLIKSADGKSFAEKTMNAQATEQWDKFQLALAKLESVYEFEKFKLSILDKEYQAQYLELKDSERMLRKQGA